MLKLIFYWIATGGLWTVCAQTVTEAEISRSFEHWMERSPHFKKKMTPFARRSYRVQNVAKKRFGANSLAFYVVELEPEGFVVMNSDKRLPAVLAYSDTGTLNLDDVPQNAFRSLLKNSMERGRRRLLNLSISTAAVDLFQPLEEAQNVAEWEALLDSGTSTSQVVFASAVVTNGPFLTTSWNQNNHYNELCPESSDVSSYYDGHVPVGCVAVVGAQIMKYYQWPYRGSGSHSYTDGSGSITGVHTADFSDPFDWANMQDDYYARAMEPQAAVDAVSELMYETGVAVEMDYESDGSASYTSDLNKMMNQAFLYDKGIYSYTPGDSQSVADQLRADMLASRPGALSIPGHLVVADGYTDDGASEYFHLNYGWGGANDGWYLVDDIAGNLAVGCISGLYPALMPVNRTESGMTNSSSDVALEWDIAAVRKSEVQSVSVLQHILQGMTFSDSADDFSWFASTSTDEDYDWVVTNSGYLGSCFYKEPYSYSNREYHLTSIDKFIPGSGSQLSFHLKARLGTAVFRVMVSEDDGESWAEEYSLSDYYNNSLSWQSVTVSLSAYVGSEVLIRFEYVSGSYYSGGGVWLDDIQFIGGGWYDWDTIQTSSSLSGTIVTNLSEGTNTLALQAYDGAEFGARSPSFTVIVENADSDGDGIPNEWELQYFGSETGAVAGADSDGDGFKNEEEYLAGFDPTDAESFFNVAPAASGVDGFVIQWQAVSGRVYSVHRAANLVDGFLPLATNIFWPQSSYTDTVHQSESDGFYRVDVQLGE